MKTLKRFNQIVLAASLLSSLPFVYAAEAPVEDLSTNSIYADRYSEPTVHESESPTDNLAAVSSTGNLRPPGHPLAQPTQQQDSQEALEPSHRTQIAVEGNTIEPAADNTMAKPMGTKGLKGNRLERLEQQVNNIVSMNIPQQVSELQQAIQQLNGRLQLQQHELQTLQTQQRRFYQDLNARIRSVSPAVTQQFKSAQLLKSAARHLKNHSTVVERGSEGSQSYHRAFQLLVDKKYTKALTAFEDYIVHYPNSVFIANAYYWTGELYFKKGDAESAASAFNRVLAKYPRSNKVPDAKLKLAIIHAHSGKATLAQQEFRSIKHQYPGSTASQLASIQLQSMGMAMQMQ